MKERLGAELKRAVNLSWINSVKLSWINSPRQNNQGKSREHHFPCTSVMMPHFDFLTLGDLEVGAYFARFLGSRKAKSKCTSTLGPRKDGVWLKLEVEVHFHFHLGTAL